MRFLVCALLASDQVCALLATLPCRPFARARQPTRLYAPRCGVLDELTEEAEDSWLSRFLPKKDGPPPERSPTQLISEQPVMFVKEDGPGPGFDFQRWEVHRSDSRCAPRPAPEARAAVPSP